MPLDGRGNAGIENRRPQRRGHVANQLEQLRDQALHARQALVQLGHLPGANQLAHRRLQLEYGQHLAQLVMHFAGNARLLFLTHAFQVRRQFAQTRPRIGQCQLGQLVLGDIPEDAVPHHPAIAQRTRGGTNVRPQHLLLGGEDAPLPVPVAFAFQRQRLAVQIAVQILRMYQAADAALLTLQLLRRPADHLLAGLADVGKVDHRSRPGALQAEHQAGHVAGDALETRLALLQCRTSATAFGDVAEKHHQVLGLAIA